MSKGVVAVLLVVALGLGFVVGRMSVPSTTEAPAADADAPSGERPSVVPVTAPAPVPAAVGIEAPTLAASGDPVTEAFRAAYERLPAPPQARGDGVISGTVRSDTGEPIAGAVVTASRLDVPLPAAARDPTRPWPDPAGQLRERAEWIAWRESGRYRATSAPDGTWRIEGLPDVAFRVDGVANGWTLKVWGDVSREARPGDTVALVGTPRASLAVDLRREGGGPPRSATIEFRSRRMTGSQTWAPSQPAFDLEPGTYDVVATTHEYPPQRSEHVEVLIERGTSTAVVLQLRARPALRLRVKWPDGEHYPEATASVVRHEGRELPDVAAMDGLADDGRFAAGSASRLFLDLEPGRYLVVVRRSRGAGIGGHAIVEVGSGLTECEVVVPPVDRSKYVVVRVTGPDGATLPDVQLRDSGKSPTLSWLGDGETMDRPDGTAWYFPGAAARPDAPEMRWRIHATHAQYGSRSVEVPRGTARDVTIRMDEPARLEVVLVPGEGAPPLGEFSVVWFDDAGSDAAPSNRSVQAVASVGSDGRVTLPRLQPAAGVVAVYHVGSDRRRSQSLIHRAPATLRSGPQTVEIRLPRLHAVTLRGAPGLTVHLVREGDPSWSHTVEFGRSGTAVVGPMPDGAYTVAGMLESASFTLPGATEVDLR